MNAAKKKQKRQPGEKNKARRAPDERAESAPPEEPSAPPQRDRWPARRILLFLVPLFFLFAFPIGFWPALPGANESAHVYLGMAMYERGQRNVDQEVLDYFFNHDLVLKDQHFVSNKPPGTALWLIPGLALIDLVTPGSPELWTYHYFGRLLMVTLTFIIFLFILGRFLERLTRPAIAWGLVFAFAIGSNASAYATMLFSHNLAGMALALTFMLIWRDSIRWRWVGGLLCGFAVITEYRTLGMAGVLAAVSGFGADGRFRWGRFLNFAAAGFPLAGALVVHNLATTGNVFGPYIAEMQRFKISGFFGFGLPSPAKAIQTLFSPALGLFFFAPWLALVIPATVYVFRRKPAGDQDASARRRRFLLIGAVAAAFVHLLLVIAHRYYVGGAVVGPRYLTASIPFYLFPIAAFLGGLDKRWPRGTQVAIVASVAVAVIVHLVILSTTAAINTHRDGLAQNAIRSFIFPLMEAGVSSLSVARYFGASAAVSTLIYILLALGVVAGFAVPYLLAAGKAQRIGALVGGGLGIVLFPVWVFFGSTATETAEHHIPRLASMMDERALRRTEDGRVWFKPRPVATPKTPVRCRFDVRSNAFFELITKDTEVYGLAANFYTLRAPLWCEDGSILFSDASKNTVFRRTPDARLEVFRAFAGYAEIDLVNYLSPGIADMLREPDGSILMTEQGNRRITRLKPDGTLEVVADRFEGRRFNSPSFMARAQDGTLYFTDPPLGLPFQHDDVRRQMDYCGVFRLRNGQLELLDRGMTAPMGIALSPDDRSLYVANFAGQEQAIYRHTLAPDGSLGRRIRFIDMTKLSQRSRIEAFTVDRAGNLYVCGPGGLFIYDRNARFLGALALPLPPMGVSWGGPDGKQLLIAGIDSLYQVKTNIGGQR